MHIPNNIGSSVIPNNWLANQLTFFTQVSSPFWRTRASIWSNTISVIFAGWIAQCCWQYFNNIILHINSVTSAINLNLWKANLFASDWCIVPYNHCLLLLWIYKISHLWKYAIGKICNVTYVPCKAVPAIHDHKYTGWVWSSFHDRTADHNWLKMEVGMTHENKFGSFILKCSTQKVHDPFPWLDWIMGS